MTRRRRGRGPAPGQQCVDGVGDVVQGLQDDHGVERPVVGDCRRRQGCEGDVDAGRRGVEAGIVDRRGVVVEADDVGLWVCRGEGDGRPSLPASDVGDPGGRARVAQAWPDLGGVEPVGERGGVGGPVDAALAVTEVGAVVLVGDAGAGR